jgi:Mor family transcriptional regulator
MASEFMADATERLITTLVTLGISQQTAGMVAVEWQTCIVRDWGGDRPYIGKSSDAVKKMSARDNALLREWHAGERPAALARKYNLSTRRVRQIVFGGNALS